MALSLSSIKKDFCIFNAGYSWHTLNYHAQSLYEITRTLSFHLFYRLDSSRLWSKRPTLSPTTRAITNAADELVMSHFYYRDNELYAEGLPVTDIAHRFGTPCYIYSREALTQNWQAFDHALQGQPHKICYAVKANSNLAVLNVLARLGSGFDIVSVGELERVLAAGGDPHHVVFSGVGKQTHEIKRALEVSIECFNVESSMELERLNHISGELGKKASISLRINPDIDAGTHPYIATGLKENKFGIDINDALALYQRAASLENIQISGIGFHIGSQLTELSPFCAALTRILSLTDELISRGMPIDHLDIGGGLGVRYRDEQPPTPAAYITTMRQLLGKRDLKLILEPGRAIAANAGILVTRVEYLKHTVHKNFAIVDAAKNDLLRPALYGAWQNIIPSKLQHKLTEKIYDIVGPVCETSDFLGKDRSLKITPGDLLVIECAGAYGFVMGSNYNSRPRAPELMVDGDQVHVVRRRETINELFATETVLS